MGREAIGCRFFVEYLPKDSIRIPITSHSDSSHVLANLVLKFVQPFESFGLFFSDEIKPKRAAMDREIIGHNR